MRSSTLVLTVFLIARQWEHFLKAATKAVKTTGTILLLIGISATFGYLISLCGVAELTGAALEQMTTTPWVIFLLVNDPVRARHLPRHGCDHPVLHADLPADLHEVRHGSVQFGMVLLINCALGLNTPPVGTRTVHRVHDRWRFGRHVMRTIWPFYGALIAAMLIVTYVPAFSMWLPNLVLAK